MDRRAPLEGTYDAGSFRDPASRIVYHDGRVMRLLSKQGLADWEALARSRLFNEWTSSGRLVETRAAPGGEPMLEHTRIPFWSYPYEWSFSMLRDAARLQLELLEAALAEDLTLKDASPYNIAFRGSRPVFCDIGSFMPYTAGEPWLGYRQFCQLFLYPLLLRAHAGLDVRPLLRGSLGGITAGQTRAVLRGRRLFAPGVMVDVALQARAEKSLAASRRDVRGELSAAGFSKEMIVANLRRLRKVLDRTTWNPDASTWSDYAGCAHVATQRSPKENFIRSVMGARHRSLVWDLGTNDGFFARLAAENTDTVVAIDGDELVIDRLYRSLSPGDGILPLVIDLADPSPGMGWRGRERRRLEERGSPELVLLLAVVHHMVVGSNLPLTEVMDWVASLRAEAVFEWVPPDDPMTQRLTANKRGGEVHSDYTEADLRRLISERFEVRAETGFEGRILFHLAPRT